MKQELIRLGLALVAGVTGILGGWSPAMTTLITLMTLDVISGFARAFCQKKLSSKESFRGMTRKALILVIVAVAAQVDLLLSQGSLARDVVVISYCLTEALSVIENVVASGLQVPDVLRQALEQLNERKFVPGRTPPAEKE